MIDGLQVKTLPLFLVRDHNLNFALENDIEFRTVVTKSKDIFSYVIEVVLEFLTKEIYILAIHIPLFKETDLFKKFGDISEVFIFALIFWLKQYLNDRHKLVISFNGGSLIFH
jgi:hypothetical protein